MNEQIIITAAADPPAHVCPRHPEVTLTLLLKGGAGWCSACCCYQQSCNHAEPLRVIPRPPIKTKVKKAAKASKRATNKRTAKRRKVTAPAHIGAAFN